MKAPLEDVLTHRLLDPANGEEAAYYCFVEIERPSPERAVVEVQTLGSGHEYTLQREEDCWAIVHAKLICIP